MGKPGYASLNPAGQLWRAVPRSWPAMLAFLVLLAAYLASPVRTPFDSRWSVQTSMSLLRGQGGSLAAYEPVLRANADYAIERRDGVPRTIYPVGVSVLAMPAVLLVSLLDPTFEPSLAVRLPARTEHAVASVIGAAAGALFFLLLRRELGSGTGAALGTAMFALGTTLWSDATRALWQHGPLVLFLVIAMLLLQRKRYAAIGLPLAAAFLMRPTAAIPIAVLSALVLIRRPAALPGYLAGAAVIAVPWLLFNLSVYHQILPPYYLVASGEAPVPPGFPLEGLAGVLASPGRGLLVYSPAMLLAPWGFALAVADPARRGVAIAYAAIVLASIGLAAQWAIWWGGHAYGPRLLTDIVPFLVFFVAIALARARQLAWGARGACLALVLLSMLLQAPGALSWQSWVWNVEPANVDLHTARLWDWRDPPFLRFLRRGA